MKLNISVIPARLCVMIALVAAMSVASYGQGSMEVTGHFGIVGGIGSHASLGGSVGAPIANHLILSGDLSYIPLGSTSVTAGGATTKSSASALDFNGNLQYEFTPSHSVVPYAGAGIGFLRSSGEVSSSNPRPGTINVSVKSTDAYFNFGGGLRHYVKPNWGFRPEFMIFAGSNTFVRFVGGIFYQFGE